MPKVKINKVPQYQKGGSTKKGWKPSDKATVDTPVPQGISATPYKPFEGMQLVPTRNYTDQEKNIMDAERRNAETTPIGANIPWRNKAHYYINKATNWIPEGSLRVIPELATYPLHAAVNLTDPSGYFQGTDGNAQQGFVGAGNMMVDAATVASMMPRGKAPVPKYNDSKWVANTAKKIKGNTAMPTLVSPETLSKEQQILENFGLDPYKKRLTDEEYIKQMLENTERANALFENIPATGKPTAVTDDIAKQWLENSSKINEDKYWADLHKRNRELLDKKYPTRDHTIRNNEEVPMFLTTSPSGKGEVFEKGYTRQPWILGEKTFGSYGEPGIDNSWNNLANEYPETYFDFGPKTPYQRIFENRQDIPESLKPTARQKNQYGGPIMQQGGPVMNTTKRIRVKKVPNQVPDNPMMQYGGPLPGTGTASPGNYSVLDTSWNVNLRGDTQYYGPNAYKTGRTLPESDDPDVIVEKKEKILGDFTGDGTPSLMAVDTGTHASGQDQGINVPDGAFVFSDTKDLKIKDKDILKQFGMTKSATPAKIAGQYDLQKYKALIDNPTKDNMTKKTAQLMYNNYMNKLQNLASVQEEMKEPHEHTIQMQYGGRAMAHEFDENGKMKFVPADEGSIDTVPAYNPPWSWDGVLPQPPVNRDANIPYHPDYIAPVDIIPPTYTQYKPKDAPPAQPINMKEAPIGENIGTVAAPPTSKGTVRTPRISANTWGDVALGLKAFNTKKYTPWEPPVQTVIPQTVFMDPTRELAANGEQANQAYRTAAMSGDSRTARANSTAIQGKAGENAANILGRYQNANVQIANQANAQAANIMNTQLMQERERLKRLYDGNIISQQQYTNSQNQLLNEFVKRKEGYEDERIHKAWLNKTSPYFAIGPDNIPVFKSKEAEAAFNNEVLGRQSSGKGVSYADIVAQKVAEGYSQERAEDYADDYMRNISGMNNRTRTTYDKNGNVKGSTTTTKRLGGFTSSGLDKFIAKRLA